MVHHRRKTLIVPLRSSLHSWLFMFTAPIGNAKPPCQQCERKNCCHCPRRFNRRSGMFISNISHFLPLKVELFYSKYLGVGNKKEGPSFKARALFHILS
jgi:hypothetical protein